MPIGPGTSLGAYEITALLGAGGMGEVYRAHDTELGRDVAIKVLPPAFTGDSERLSRFEREARALAALNHPHIGAIYGVERTEDGRALVLELVEGETLADRISRGPLPVQDAIRVASQIAAALEAAHRKGIVHRDLKPANIKFAADGTVKVLDFGLAKIAEAPVLDDSQSPTVTASGTLQGVVLGTAGYMSPEQARGQAVDARTDLWAFGCVLYEMLTGRRAFRGQTVSDTMARILEREPDWTAMPRATPTTVRELVRRCLKKYPFERPADISTVRDVLDRARVSSRHPARVGTVALVAAAAVVALSLGVFVWFRSDRLTPTDPTKWQQLTNFPDAAVQPALSSDGRMLAFIRGESTFASLGEVYLKMLPGGEPTPLTRDGLPKMDPVFSPDGRRVAYSVVSEPNMTRPWNTWEVPVIRGEPRAWLDNASGLRWVDADQLLFSQVRGVRHMGIVTAKEDRSQLREAVLSNRSAGNGAPVRAVARWALGAPRRDGRLRGLHPLPSDLNLGRVGGAPGRSGAGTLHQCRVGARRRVDGTSQPMRAMVFTSGDSVFPMDRRSSSPSAKQLRRRGWPSSQTVTSSSRPLASNSAGYGFGTRPAIGVSRSKAMRTGRCSQPTGNDCAFASRQASRPARARASSG